MAGFFDMGGYAAFVWPAYGLAVVVFIVLAVLSFKAARDRALALKKLQAQSPHRQRRAKARTRTHSGEAGDDGL
jgi:heme exporter protein D